jgi:3-hydroxyisobutyrate dehydrogenase
MAQQSQIGFVGIGAMGSHMAANLIRKQFPVSIYDIDRPRQERFAQSHQCRSASTLADLAQDVSTVITMLPTGRDVREVLLDAENGALAKALSAGAIVIDMSSSDPAGTRALATMLAGRGVTLIDAPVSGGTKGAEAASLTIMIGSDDKAAVARIRPVLAAMGQKMFETGGSGTGHAMKALNNFVAGTNYLAVAEALVVGTRFGLDPALMTDIINQSTGRNFSTENLIKQQVLSRKFASGFALALLAKDVKIAADLADGLAAHAPVSALVRDLLASARDMCGPGADHSSAIRYWETRNGVTVGGENKS